MDAPAPTGYVLLNRQRKHRVNASDIREFLSSLVGELGSGGRPFSIVLTTDERIRKYNRVYRRKDKATDVLSFPGENGYLGDILISSETAYNQARRSRTLNFQKNLKRLILHGLLHLMGYDHERDQGEMKALERNLRRKCRC